MDSPTCGHRDRLPLADFRFTQDETQDTVIEVAAGSSKKSDWLPRESQSRTANGSAVTSGKATPRSSG